MKKTHHLIDVMRLAAGASLLIGLGDFALLKLGEPIGPVLFSLGLLGVCMMKLNLFTGKCGFLIEDKISILELIIILIINLLFGYAIGVIFTATDSSLMPVASSKVASWGISWGYFLKSCLCGAIMYIAVELYRRGTKLGILIGVPLFIFCGFQHSIANVITMGVAMEFNVAILLCVAGNFVGALATWGLCRTDKNQ